MRSRRKAICWRDSTCLPRRRDYSMWAPAVAVATRLGLEMRRIAATNDSDDRQQTPHSLPLLPHYSRCCCLFRLFLAMMRYYCLLLCQRENCFQICIIGDVVVVVVVVDFGDYLDGDDDDDDYLSCSLSSLPQLLLLQARSNRTRRFGRRFLSRTMMTIALAICETMT